MTLAHIHYQLDPVLGHGVWHWRSAPFSWVAGEGLARWGIETDEHGRVRVEDLRHAVDDGRIKPTVLTPEYQRYIDERQEARWDRTGLGDLLLLEE